MIDCYVRDNENDKKFDNEIYDYRLTSPYMYMKLSCIMIYTCQC